MSTTNAVKSEESDQAKFSVQHWMLRKGEYLYEMRALGLEGISRVGPNLHIVWGFGDAYAEYSDVREAIFAARDIEVVDSAWNAHPEFWAELVSGASYTQLVSTLKAAKLAHEHEGYEVAEDPDACDD